MEEIYFSYNEALKCWNLIQNKDIARFYLYEVHEQTWTELSVGCRSRYWSHDAYSIATTRNDITLSMTALVGGWSRMKYQCSWITYVHQCIREYLKSNKILTTCHGKYALYSLMNELSQSYNVIFFQYGFTDISYVLAINFNIFKHFTHMWNLFQL